MANRSQAASPGDVKIRATVTCIIEEFFRANPDILLYMCDSANDQQAMRSQLFMRWFNAYARQQDFYIRTEMVTDEGEENYIALIVHLFTFLFAFPPSISDIIDKISPLNYMRVTYQLHTIRNCPPLFIGTIKRRSSIKTGLQLHASYIP